MAGGGWLDEAAAAAAVASYNRSYDACYDSRVRLRLGLSTRYSVGAAEESAVLVVRQWLVFLDTARVDYHIASRALVTMMGTPPASPATGFATPAAGFEFSSQDQDQDQDRLMETALIQSPEAAAAKEAFVQALRLHLYTHVVNRAASIPGSYLSGLCIREWREQVARQVPFFVMRTAPSRAITTAAVAGTGKYVRVAREILQSPFRRADSAGSRNTPTGEAAPPDETDSDVMTEWVAHALSNSPPPDQSGEQTSCGGQ